MRAHLYFVRHGETVANRDGIRQGVSADYPLTDRGHDQAARAGTALQGVQWHAVYSSDLPRAVKTCEYILDKAGTNLITQELVALREVNFGIRENLPVDMTSEEARQVTGLQKGVPPESIEDCAESEVDISRRQMELLRTIGEHVQRFPTEVPDSPPKVLCVSHGRFIRSLIADQCKVEVPKLKNGSISIIEVAWDDQIDVVTVFPVQIHEFSHVDF